MELNERCEMAMEILRMTEDGDKLGTRDLKLLESAVNGFLTETGYRKFTELYNQVIEGSYKLPWFHGIKHLTIDPDGCVYWKNQQVEHYDIPWAYSDEAKSEAEELERRCLLLESKGVKINAGTAIWGWKEGANYA